MDSSPLLANKLYSTGYKTMPPAVPSGRVSLLLHLGTLSTWCHVGGGHAGCQRMRKALRSGLESAQSAGWKHKVPAQQELSVWRYQAWQNPPHYIWLVHRNRQTRSVLPRFKPTHFAALEILHTWQNYECKVDVWSFGVVAYEVLAGAKPFPVSTLRELEFLQKEGVL